MRGNSQDKQQRALILPSSLCKVRVNMDNFIFQSPELESCNKPMTKGLVYSFLCFFYIVNLYVQWYRLWLIACLCPVLLTACTQTADAPTPALDRRCRHGWVPHHPPSATCRPLQPRHTLTPNPGSLTTQRFRLDNVL